MKQSKSRKDRESTAFLYSRLSRDDNLDGDSYSISNQKKLLSKVAKEKGYTDLVHYFDDGKSGVTMNRPGFNEMMEELKKGRASAVFFKDMSRLGRNYIEVGKLCEEFFPENDIRYVAVSDNVDSDEGESELTPIRNLFNEWYARDISKKRRISNKVKGNAGIPLSPPPYGYIKDPDNPKQWAVDPEAANVVRKMFDMVLRGYGVHQIAIKFSQEKILTPAAYSAKNGTRKPSNKKNSGPFDWNHSTIIKMLAKQEYCGDVINFKSYSKSFKNKKRIQNDKDNMKIFENIHEPIIDRQTFELAQNRRTVKRRALKSTNERHLFSGLLRCEECGSTLNYRYNYNNRDIEYYSCPENNRARGKCSKTHYIRVDFLEKVILAEVKRLAQFVRENEEDFILMTQIDAEASKDEQNKHLKEELTKLEGRDKELDMLFEQMYEDNVSGKLSDDRFRKLSVKYENEQEIAVKRVTEIEEELQHQDNLATSINWFVDAIKKYTRLKKLKPDVLLELIDCIDVYHTEKNDGMSEQQLTIYYNCIGAITLPTIKKKRKADIKMKTRKGVEVNYSLA